MAIKKGYDKKPNGKNATGRPSKVGPFLIAFDKVVNDNINAIIYTDEDLFFVTNDNLEEKDRVCYATFQNYKNTKDAIDKEDYQKFLGLYKKALNKQKKNLFEKLEKDSKARQKYAWIIERKFDNWNIKHKTDLNVKGDITVKTPEI